MNKMMTVKIIIIYFFFLLISSPVKPAFASYVKYSENPVLLPSDNSWDSTFTWQQTVLDDGEEYKMWYTGGNQNGKFQIGLAHSVDGKTWTKDPNNPVVSKLSADRDVHDPSVIKDGNNYVMWYTSSKGGGGSDYKIYRATSTNGISWSDYPESPVLQSNQSWEQVGVASPTVIKVGSNYHMWYIGTNDYSAWNTGYAVSPDGISWTPYSANPILSKDQNWEGVNNGGMSVTFENNKFTMVYGTNSGFGYSAIAKITSTDGINWDKSTSANPILIRGPDLYDSNFITDPTLIKKNNSELLWYSSNGQINNLSKWGISLAVQESLIPTPTPIINRKVVIIPGIGGSWNKDAFLKCNLTNTSGDWTPWLMNGKDPYETLINSLESAGFIPLPYYYDWRKPVIELVPQLDSFINANTSSPEKFQLLGHSYGGLLGRSYLEFKKYDNQLGKLLTIGSPHHGAVLSYPAWAAGEVWIDDINFRLGFAMIQIGCGLQHKWSSKDIIQNIFPSIQNLLPTFDYLTNKGTNELISISTMKTRNNWLPTEFSHPFYGVTVGTLSGTGRRTLQGLLTIPPSRKEIKQERWIDGKPQTPIYGVGDGTVLNSSSQINGAQNFSLPMSHSELIWKPEAISSILDFLNNYSLVNLSKNQNISLETSINNPTTALLIVLDGTKGTLVDSSGKMTHDSDGQITILNPNESKYILTINPEEKKWWQWWKLNFSVIVVQLFDDGTMKWKKYNKNKLHGNMIKIQFKRFEK